jgi:hypothetical protein
MVRDLGQREESGAKRKEDVLTVALALVWTAWRGSARAVGQRLPEEDFTMAPRRAPHHRRAHTHRDFLEEAPQAPGSSRQGGGFSGVTGQFPERGLARISSERRRPANPLGGDGRGREGSNSPKVAATELTGVGQSRQVAAR